MIGGTAAALLLRIPDWDHARWGKLHDHVPLDFELYLPQPWIDDVELRQEARIPDDASFQTKVDSFVTIRTPVRFR